VLKSAGIERGQIEVAQTGVEARRLLAANRYDLLILDIALPMRAEDEPDRRGGLKLLEEVLDRGAFQLPTSVVGLTGFTELRDDFSTWFRSKLWTLELYEPSDSGWIERLRAKVGYIVARCQQNAKDDFRTDICVLAALHSPELRALRRIAWNWSPPKSLDEVGYYYEGICSIGGVDRTVVAAAAPRMGMVASAVLTVNMIAKFRPRLLAMVGICAGVKGECNIGDVLVADPSWDWQMGKLSPDGLSVSPDQIDIPTAVSTRFVQLADAKQMWLELYESYPGPKPANLPTVKVGPVTSGSAVLADAKLLAEIRKQHRKLIGVDMELYGVYAASRDCSPPNPITFGLKSVCDYADSQKSDEFQEYAAHMSVGALREFCARFGADFL